MEGEVSISRHRFALVQIPARLEETAALIMEYIAWWNHNSEEPVKRVHGDNAIEFLVMKEELDKMGIELTTTSVHTPESNGLSRRMNRKLMDKTLSLLQEARLPQQWMGAVLLHSVVLHKRRENLGLGMKTPFELLHGKPSRNNHTRVFGHATYVYIYKANGKCKFENRANLDMYVRLRNGLDYVYVREGIALVTNKHVLFDE